MTVRNSDGSTNTSASNFTVINPTPSITTISPNSAFNTSSAVVTISGSNFASGLDVLLINGSTNFTATVSGVTSSKITATLPLPGKLALIYNVQVINPGLGSPNATKVNAFTVKAPNTDPSITSFNPTSGQNTAPLPLTVNGTNFRAGATITITNGLTTKTVTGTMSNGGTTLKGTLPLKDLVIGQYTVTVRNSDGSSNTSATNLTVYNPTPTITTVTPGSGFNTRSVALTISGTNFVNNLTATLTNGSTTIVGTVSGRTATKFTGTFPLTSVPAGLYTLNVSNPGTPNATKANCFNLQAPSTAPTFTSINPNSGPNTAALPVNITGTQFRIGATVTITNGSTSKTVNGVMSNNGNTLKCTLPLIGLSIGLYDVTIRNSDGSLVIAPTAFQVNNTAPTVTKITPASAYNTSTVTVTIGGTKFVEGAAIALNNRTNWVSGSVVTRSATSITGTFPLNGALAVVYDVVVSNPGNVNGTKQKAFTVLQPGSAAIIASVNPASGFNNANLPVTIAGMNFKTPTVYFNQGSLTKIAPATAGKKLTSTTLYVTLPLKGIPGGYYNITVSNSDRVNTTGTGIFYVTDQAWISKAPKTIGRSSVDQKPDLSVTKVMNLAGVVGPSGRSIVG